MRLFAAHRLRVSEPPRVAGLLWCEEKTTTTKCHPDRPNQTIQTFTALDKTKLNSWWKLIREQINRRSKLEEEKKHKIFSILLRFVSFFPRMNLEFRDVGCRIFRWTASEGSLPWRQTNGCRCICKTSVPVTLCLSFVTVRGRPWCHGNDFAARAAAAGRSVALPAPRTLPLSLKPFLFFLLPKIHRNITI